jgi:hypothetical protein
MATITEVKACVLLRSTSVGIVGTICPRCGRVVTGIAEWPVYGVVRLLHDDDAPSRAAGG